MSFIGGHIPLDLWLRACQGEREVLDVSLDLLRALVALEELGVYHLFGGPKCSGPPTESHGRYY